jgi:glycosyltransferase involved in cell wall biosynthesis
MDISVIITAYNKGPYIKECLLGVLNQDFKGEFEIILADDCSTDNTKEVVESLCDLANYNKVKYTRHDINKGLMGNFIWAIDQAKGKYLAFCDADDYWTDNNKLTFQINELNSNLNLIMVGAIMEFKDLRNQEALLYKAKYLEHLDEGILVKDAFYDIVKVPFHISSFVCLNSDSVKRKLNRFKFTTVSNDIVLWCLLTQVGDCFLSRKIVGKENHVVNGITQIQNHLSLSYRLNKLILWKTLFKELESNNLKNLSKENYIMLKKDFNKRLINADLKTVVEILKNKEYNNGVWVMIFRTWIILKFSRYLINNNK